MLRIAETVIVEGRYDKATLSNVVDAPIIETRGFGIYNDPELLPLLRRLARAGGVVILTDSDAAGFQIRGYIKGAIPDGRVLSAYIPDVPGRERRKSSPSAEGKLGVEGMRPDVLEQALLRAGVTVIEGDAAAPTCRISKADLYRLGLSGREGSAAARRQLLRRLELPERLPPNSMADVLGALMTLEELETLVSGSEATRRN